MATSNFRRSKQDKLLKGILNILKDNKKKIDVINKLMCCFDILLSKQHNVSESPGYEKILKQFGRRQEEWM